MEFRIYKLRDMCGDVSLGFSDHLFYGPGDIASFESNEKDAVGLKVVDYAIIEAVGPICGPEEMTTFSESGLCKITGFWGKRWADDGMAEV